MPQFEPSNSDTCVSRDVVGQRRAVDREAVVHAGDLDHAVGQPLDRMVGAAVALVHLGGLARPPRGRASGGRGRCRTSARRVSSSPWITGTAYSPVAAGSPGPFDRNTPSGLSARMLVERGLRRHHGDPRAGLDQVAEDVVLRAIVDRDDVRRGIVARLRGHSPCPSVQTPPSQPSCCLAADALGEVHALQPRPLLRALEQRGMSNLPFGIVRDHRVGRAAGADAAGQRAGVDARQGRSARAASSSRRTRSLARKLEGAVTSSRTTQPTAPSTSRLDVLGVGADVADVREGEGDDLRRRRTGSVMIS